MLGSAAGRRGSTGHRSRSGAPSGPVPRARGGPRWGRRSARPPASDGTEPCGPLLNATAETTTTRSTTRSWCRSAEWNCETMSEFPVCSERPMPGTGLSPCSARGWARLGVHRGDTIAGNHVVALGARRVLCAVADPTRLRDDGRRLMTDATAPPVSAPHRPRPAARWVKTKDPDLLVIKRSVRAAVVMPAVFAITHVCFSDPQVSLFAAFGSFALLLLVEFTGTARTRLVSYVGLFLAGSCFIVLGHGGLDPQGRRGRDDGRGRLRRALRRHRRRRRRRRRRRPPC